MLEYKGKQFLCHLEDGPIRFLELQRITGNITHKVLNEKLTELENEGLIIKKVYPEVPPRVEYSLTPMGKDLSPALKMIEQWAVQNFR